MINSSVHPLPRWRKLMLGALAVTPVLLAPSVALAAPPESSVTQTASFQEQSAAASSTVVDSTEQLGKTETPGQDLVDTVAHVRKVLARLEKAAAQGKALEAQKTTVGGYDATFEIGRVRLDPVHQVQVDSDRPNLKTHLGLTAETTLLSGHLEKSRTLANGVESAQGFNASIVARYRVDVKHTVASESGNRLERQHALQLDARDEVYHTWNREISDDERFNVGVYGGFYTDILHSSPQLYVEASQELQHDIPSTTRWFGHTTISATAREGTKHYLRTGDAAPYFELAGTVSRPVPVSLLGSQDLLLSTGITVGGYKGAPVSVQPEVNGTLRWGSPKTGS